MPKSRAKSRKHTPGKQSLLTARELFEILELLAGTVCLGPHPIPSCLVKGVPTCGLPRPNMRWWLSPRMALRMASHKSEGSALDWSPSGCSPPKVYGKDIGINRS